MAYFDWVDDAIGRLHGQISQADIERLVLTRGYQRLLAAATGSHSGIDAETSSAISHGPLYTELDQRVAAFDEACKSLATLIDRWSEPEPFLLFDTSVYINAPHKLDELDIRNLFGGVEDPTFRLIVPIIVVDELDGLKQCKDTHTRTRARQTLAVLDRVSEGLGQDRLPNNVTVEILFDPPGHIRLPISDDEIIDRALAIQPLAGTRVILATYDTGQSTRARAAGLAVKKLVEPPEPEPTNEPSRREQRRRQRERNAAAADSNQAAPADANTA